MIERPTAWREVEPGMVIQAPNLVHWLVIEQRLNGLGEPWLRIMSKYKEVRSIPRPADGIPVVVMDATEEEAVALATKTLGASHLLQWEDDKTLGRRAEKWVMPAVSHSGKSGKERIRDHIDMHHGVYVNDDWKARKAADLATWHAEMHTDEHLVMTMPHQHEEKR